MSSIRPNDTSVNSDQITLDEAIDMARFAYDMIFRPAAFQRQIRRHRRKPTDKAAKPVILPAGPGVLNPVAALGDMAPKACAAPPDDGTRVACAAPSDWDA